MKSFRFVLLVLLWTMGSTCAQTPMALSGGRIYQGDLEDGEPYGFGTMVYPNGTRYRGQFVNGYREGRGAAVFYDASRYEGDWRNDIPHGRGVIEWPTGERYEGDIVENTRSGRGVMTFRDGTRYDGEWQVVLELKTPYRDGTSHLVMSALECMQRLAALVPRPRLHLIGFQGVLAPHAKLRAAIVPIPAPSTTSHATDCEHGHGASARMSWARLLKRVFDIDIERARSAAVT
jgi:hypothetical protein